MKDFILIVFTALVLSACTLLGYVVEVQNNTGSTIFVGDTQLDEGGFIWVSEERALEIEEDFECTRSGDLLSIDSMVTVEISINLIMD